MNELLDNLHERLSKIGTFFVAWSSKVSYASAGAGTVFAFDANTIGVAVSLIIGAATWFTNHMSKKNQEARHSRNEARLVEEHELRMAAYKRGLDLHVVVHEENEE
jgi:hypothetical protein